MTDFIMQGFETIFQNAWAMTFSDGLLLIVILMSIIFAIQDYRIGLMTLFLLSITAYIFYVIQGLSLTNVTMLVFVSLLLLAFSLYASKSGNGGLSLG